MYYPSGVRLLYSMPFYETKGDNGTARICYGARGTNWYSRHHISHREIKYKKKQPTTPPQNTDIVYTFLFLCVHFFLLVLFSFCIRNLHFVQQS